MPSENSQSRTSVQSIVRRPWDFACQWYDVESIHHGINHDKSIVPADVYSREFAEFLAEQYRLAMRKGAELAASELCGGIRATLLQPQVWITESEREGWNVARREVERFIDGED